MNRKNIKKVIAIALVLSFAPALASNITSLGTTTVYAASDSGYVTDVKLETSNGKDVQVYTKSTYKSKYELDEIDGKAPTSLYAHVGSNVKKIKVTDIDLGTDCDSAKIYKGSTEISLDDEIKISGDTTLKIKAYKGSDLKETYNLKIEKGSSSSSSDDDIYLDDLSLTDNSDNDISLDFDKDKTTYDITVKNKVSYVKIKAEPEDSDNTVKIDGNTVEDGDDWIDKVSLTEGKNAIPVKVKDDDGNDREYDLNITRESSGSTSSTSSSTTTTTATNLATSLSEGWQQVSGNWCFIGPDGSKQTGWQKVDGKWYYMDDSGTMQTGWIKSSVSGKWYYLNPISNGYKGSMLTSTTIDSYKIGYDGARTN